jgi:hypothetical protein
MRGTQQLAPNELVNLYKQSSPLASNMDAAPAHDVGVVVPEAAAANIRQCAVARMVRRPSLSDFRAVRIMLEPNGFAISDGQDVPPSDQIEEETQFHHA